MIRAKLTVRNKTPRDNTGENNKITPTITPITLANLNHTGWLLKFEYEKLVHESTMNQTEKRIAIIINPDP